MYKAPTDDYINRLNLAGEMQMRENPPLISTTSITVPYIGIFSMNTLPAIPRSLFKFLYREGPAALVVRQIEPYSGTAFRNNTEYEALTSLFIEFMLNHCKKTGRNVIRVSTKARLIEDVLVDKGFKIKRVGTETGPFRCFGTKRFDELELLHAN